MSAELLQKLIEAGTPADLVAEVAEMMGDLRSLERRRNADRQRQQDKRDRDRHVMSRDVTDVTDTPSPSLSPNENLNPNPTPTRVNPHAREEAPDLPAGATAEQWLGFVEMRRKIRKPLTPHAVQLAVRKLWTLADAGQPPGEVLDQSTMNCWQSLQEVKANGNGYQNRSGPGPRQADGFGKVLREVSAREAGKSCSGH